MKIPPYTVPDADADLLMAGTLLEAGRPAGVWPPPDPCVVCGSRIPKGPEGITKTYCTVRCRILAARRRARLRKAAVAPKPSRCVSFDRDYLDPNRGLVGPWWPLGAAPGPWWWERADRAPERCQAPPGRCETARRGARTGPRRGPI